MADDETVNKIQGDDGTTWVEIASVGTADEASLLSGFLEAEEIPSQIENVKFTEETMDDDSETVATDDGVAAIEDDAETENEA
jgi:hypothetical protein